MSVNASPKLDGATVDAKKLQASTTSSVNANKADIIALAASLQISALDDKPSIIIVDTFAGMTELLETISDMPAQPPSLYIDLEGVNLSRHGTISIMQIFVLPKCRTFLIDIHTLRDKAFSHAISAGTTLRSILESSSIPKVFFDVRNDSDALFSHYGISLSCVQDLQLMELATRRFSKRCVNGLGKCIENDAPMTLDERAHWKAAKNTGRNLFAPECGGSYDIFNARPISDEIIQYCAQDVQFLPKLWHKYHQKMSQKWKAKVEAEVKNRICLSQSATFNGKGRHMALAPTGWV